MTKKKNNPPAKKGNDSLFSTKEYALTLADLKKHVRASQLKAAIAANKELIRLY